MTVTEAYDIAREAVPFLASLPLGAAAAVAIVLIAGAVAYRLLRR